jgi:RNA polymerase sigma-70 factor (sigma-E family)
VVKDPSAESDFRAFAASRWPRMLRTAYLLSGHHQDAEDLVQTALEKAYVKWDRVQRSDDPDAYVWRIMINAHRDRLRLRRVREWLTTWIPERQTRDTSEQTAHRDVLLRALLRLPPPQRLAVVLRYLEDRSETEVAHLLGLRLGTVRSQTARGLEKLRRDQAVRQLHPVAGHR